MWTIMWTNADIMWT